MYLVVILAYHNIQLKIDDLKLYTTFQTVKQMINRQLSAHEDHVLQHLEVDFMILPTKYLHINLTLKDYNIQNGQKITAYLQHNNPITDLPH